MKKLLEIILCKIRKEGKPFKTCKEAFLHIGLQHDEEMYMCYNENGSNKIPCPFLKMESEGKIKHCPSQEIE